MILLEQGSQKDPEKVLPNNRRKKSQEEDSNLQPPGYEPGALPLSYPAKEKERRKQESNLSLTVLQTAPNRRLGLAPKRRVGREGLEPPTTRVSDGRSTN